MIQNGDEELVQILLVFTPESLASSARLGYLLRQRLS